jgi:hypothetical protein
VTEGSTIVCILGMHRSGTSMVAGLTNLLGVYLGPDDRMLGASRHNQKGYWEHRDIIAMNDRILARFGGDWRNVPDFPPRWETITELKDLKRDAQRVLDRDFSGQSLWGWKDPRTCLTLCFWQSFLPPIKHIIVLRNPVGVASSLERRDKLSRSDSVYLWLAYTAESLRASATKKRVLFCYEDFFENSAAELRRMAEFVGVRDRAAHDAFLSAAAAFVDESLDHSRDSAEDGSRIVADDPTAKALVSAQDVYQRLRTGALSMETALEICSEALDELRKHRDEVSSAKAREWQAMLQESARDIAAVVPASAAFLLADQNEWGTSRDFSGRTRVHFLEHNGEYWGAPADDASAIRELDRMRSDAGADFLVLARPAFWWLDHYAGFAAYLRSHFHSPLANDRVIVFDLRAKEKPQ